MIIPITGRISQQEQNDWVTAINRSSNHFTTQPIDTLTAAQLAETEVAIVANPDPEVLNQLPNIKWVQSLWAGVEQLLSENIDSAIKIVRMTDPQLAQSMTEAVLAWSLYLHRNMPEYADQQQTKTWSALPAKLPSERHIGVLGLGKLGAASAIRLQQNGFSVKGWSRTNKEIQGLQTYSDEKGLQHVLATSDILVILLPLTNETEGLINVMKFPLMQRGTSIINFARGAIIDERDLLDALDSKHIRHAVLDVFSTEPLPKAHEFWTHPSVTVLPHISAPTTVATASVIAIENIEGFLSSGVIPKAVDVNRAY